MTKTITVSCWSFKKHKAFDQYNGWVSVSEKEWTKKKLTHEKIHREVKIQVIYLQRYALTVVGYLLEYSADTFMFKLC